MAQTPTGHTGPTGADGSPSPLESGARSRIRSSLPSGPILAILFGAFCVSGVATTSGLSTVQSQVLLALSVVPIVLGIRAWIRRWGRANRIEDAFERRDLNALARLLSSGKKTVASDLLVRAVLRGDPELAGLLVDQDVTTEALDTAVVAAAGRLDVGLVSLLVGRGASPAAEDSKGLSVLRSAVCHDERRVQLPLREAEVRLDAISGILRTAASGSVLVPAVPCAECGGPVVQFRLVRTLNGELTAVCSEPCVQQFEGALERFCDGKGDWPPDGNGVPPHNADPAASLEQEGDAVFLAKTREDRSTVDYGGGQYESNTDEYIILERTDGQGQPLELVSGCMRDSHEEMRGQLGFPTRLGRSVIRDRDGDSLYAYTFQQSSLDHSWSAGSAWKWTAAGGWEVHPGTRRELIELLTSRRWDQLAIAAVDPQSTVPMDVLDYRSLSEGKVPPRKL